MGPPLHHSRVKDADQTLATLWNGIGRGTRHGMSCSCCRGGMFSLNAQQLEADLLDYLADKYKSEGITRLHDVISEHTDNPACGLIPWLLAISTDNVVPAHLASRLKNDLIDLLEKYNSTQGPSQL